MNPTWTSDCGRVQLFNADCASVIGSVKASYCVCDPPYGIEQSNGMGGGGVDGFGRNVKRRPRAYQGDWDSARPPNEILAALADFSVSVIWGGNFFSDVLPVSGKWLVWDKVNTMPSYSDCELAWTNAPGSSVKMIRYNGSGLMAIEKDRVHPTQKPAAVLVWCMEVAKVPPFATVFDPYAGSGSTIIAAIRTGRRAIGVEIDPTHLATMVKRVEKELAQPYLPGVDPAKHEQGVLL